MSATQYLLTRQEAAAALAMSLSHFQRHVQPRLRCKRVGGRRYFLAVDVERFAREDLEVGGRAA